VTSGFERHATERLMLHAATVDDTAALFPITSDPDTWRHAPDGRHGDEQVTRDWLARAAERWRTDGLSYWVVRTQSDERVIGVGGVQRQKTGNWNLYYRFAPTAWGHGYATELGRAALDAARATDDSVAIIAWIAEHNVPSRRVAERLGLVDRGAAVDPSDGVTRLAFADRPLPWH
jgi:RimJ/RimL family protein N-acetyltransferase